MKKISTKQTLLITIGISVVLVAIGIISSDTGIIGNAVIISTFLIITPILYIRYKQFREFKEMEEKFPIFLRDLIESLRSGLPLYKAIVYASNIQYGSLSKEIKKMANQITWDIPIDKVLNQFADRVKASKRLNAATQIILESYLSGGNTVSTMETVADSQLTLLETEKERRATLSQYTIVMYAISLIFIGIVIAINKLMVPIFTLSQQGTEFGISNPCTTCSGAECAICSLYEVTASNLFMIEPKSISAYYTSLFFFMSLVQSIFSGLVAGVISEGSLVAGSRHSLILTSITFGVFSILIRVGLLGV